MQKKPYEIFSLHNVYIWPIHLHWINYYHHKSWLMLIKHVYNSNCSHIYTRKLKKSSVPYPQMSHNRIHSPTKLKHDNMIFFDRSSLLSFCCIFLLIKILYFLFFFFQSQAFIPIKKIKSTKKRLYEVLKIMVWSYSFPFWWL